MDLCVWSDKHLFNLTPYKQVFGLVYTQCVSPQRNLLHNVLLSVSCPSVISSLILIWPFDAFVLFLFFLILDECFYEPLNLFNCGKVSLAPIKSCYVPSDPITRWPHSLSGVKTSVSHMKQTNQLTSTETKPAATRIMNYTLCLRVIQMTR